MTDDFLARDAEILEALTPQQRGKVERILTSFAIEDMLPERFHTEAVVDFVLGRIDSDEFATRVAAGRDTRRHTARS